MNITNNICRNLVFQIKSQPKQNTLFQVISTHSTENVVKYSHKPFYPDKYSPQWKVGHFPVI